MPYPNEHSCRLHPPGRYQGFRRVSRRSASVGKQYDVIRGRKADGEWEDQAFRYPRDRWSTDQARRHCNAHDGNFEPASPRGSEKQNIPITERSNHVMKLQWNIATLQAGIPIRQETFEGRPHLVVPVVALVEGVHAGSHGPCFYPADEIGKYVEAWNGIPLPVFHPDEYGMIVSANTPQLIEERSVGRLFNAFFDSEGAKLKGELWIDIGKAEKVSPATLSLIRSGRQLEVSTALWSDDDNIPGQWGDEEFNTTLRNYRPDHLALLPGGEGACSWTDGCGVRVNNPKKVGAKSEVDEAMKNEKSGLKEKLKALIRSVADAVGLHVQELSHEELRSKIQHTLDAMDNPGWLHFVREVYDGFVVYEARGNNPSETGQSAPIAKLYRRGFSVNDKEEITLKDDIEEVREEKTYVPVENDSTTKANIEANNKLKEARIMEKKELIEGLIACDQTKFEEKDREWLMALEEEKLERLGVLEEKEPEKKPGEEEPKKEPEKEPSKEEEPKKEPAGNEALSVEQYVEKAPPEVQSVLTRAVKRDQSIRMDLVKALMANDRNSFSEEQLKAKEIDELEGLVELGRIKVDFSGQGGGPDTNVDDNKTPDMVPVFDLKKSA